MLIKKHAECNMQHSLLCCRFSMFLCFYLLIRPLLGLIPAWCYQHNIYTHDFVDKLQYSKTTHFLHHVHRHIRHPAATGCTHPPQWWYTAPGAAHPPLSGGTLHHGLHTHPSVVVLYHGLHTPPSVVVHCTTGCTHPPQWWYCTTGCTHPPQWWYCTTGCTHPPQWWYCTTSFCV